MPLDAGRQRRLALADLAARARAGPPAGRTTVVCLDGPSGSGKTVLADRVARALGGCPVVHMDNLYPGWDGLAAAVPLLVERVLEPLAAGRGGEYPRFDWIAGRYAETRAVPATDALVVEGAGCGSRTPARHASLLVWVDAPSAERRRRALARDGDTFRPHWRRWAQQEQALFAAEGTRARADVRVDGAPEVPYDVEREVVLLG
jgi:hypothetical protein